MNACIPFLYITYIDPYYFVSSRLGGVKRHHYASQPHCISVTCSVVASDDDLEIVLSFDSQSSATAWLKVIIIIMYALSDHFLSIRDYYILISI
jgi:hypothetical protein